MQHTRPINPRVLKPKVVAAAAGVLLCAGAGWPLAHAANLFLRQHNLHFSQTEISIRVGDTITFTNEDDVIHNIGVRSSEDTQDLGLQKPGVSVSHRFQEQGAYTVVCSIHPRMRVKVNVSP